MHRKLGSACGAHPSPLSGLRGAQDEGGMTGRVLLTHLSPVWRRRLRKPSQGETFPRDRSEKGWERAVVYSVSRGLEAGQGTGARERGYNTGGRLRQRRQWPSRAIEREQSDKGSHRRCPQPWDLAGSGEDRMRGETSFGFSAARSGWPCEEVLIRGAGGESTRG